MREIIAHRPAGRTCQLPLQGAKRCVLMIHELPEAMAGSLSSGQVLALRLSAPSLPQGKFQGAERGNLTRERCAHQLHELPCGLLMSLLLVFYPVAAGI